MRPIHGFTNRLLGSAMANPPDDADNLELGIRLAKPPHALSEYLTVRAEPARERLVGHLRVALDGRLDVARGERSPLGHQEGNERELADQLVGVV